MAKSIDRIGYLHVFVIVLLALFGVGSPLYSQQSDQGICVSKPATGEDLFSVGEVRTSILSEAAFQEMNGAEWVLMDGRVLAVQTELSPHIVQTNAQRQLLVPDARGRFLRMTNSGACNELRTTAVEVLSVDHRDGTKGVYFNFDLGAFINAIGRRPNPNEIVTIYNARTKELRKAVLWPRSNGGSNGDAHGRWDSNSAPGQWQVGDSFEVYSEEYQACLAERDPDIDRAVGSYQGDSFDEHSHGYNDIYYANDNGGADIANDGKMNNLGDGRGDKNNGGYGWDRTTNPAGDAETRPKNVAVNYYIKICNCRTQDCR